MKKYFIRAIILSSFLLATHSAFAVGNSFYPSSARLQPAPAGIHANISHNVQSSEIITPNIIVEPAQPKQPNVVNTNQTTPNPAPHSNMLWWIFGIVILVLGFLIFKKRKS